MASSNPMAAHRPPGLDPYWREVGFDFTIFSVLASCEEVVKAFLAETDNIEEPPRDCLREEIMIAGDAWERAIFAYQLQGSPWTHVHPLRRDVIAITTGIKLSSALSTKALIYAYQDTAGGFLYTFAEEGAALEEFYLGDLMEDVAKLNADGWQVHGYVNLRTKRTDRCHVNSPEAKELPDTIAKELGVYVPGEVWTVDPESGRVGLEQPWSKSDFAHAKLLLSSW